VTGSASFRDHFSSAATGYATFRPRYPEPLFDFLAAAAPARSLAWDAACGNGQATLGIAERFERVIATDASQAQIAQAPAHPRVDWRVSPAEESRLTSESCDLVTVAQGLHWLDVDAFFREAARVAVPNGVVAVWTYGDIRARDRGVEALVRHYARDVVGAYWPPQRKMVDDGYRTVAFPFDEITPPSFDMRERWSFAQLVGYLRTWSATLRYMEARGEDPVARLEMQLAETWGDKGETKEVWWPLSLRVGRNRE
jgi:SAM-dependent methyltransferase